MITKDDVYTVKYECHSLPQFIERADSLRKILHPSVRILYLSGPLGAGKTTFARGWLRSSGVTGPIKSPSYSMVETYDETSMGIIHHIDLYRINDVDEVRCLGLEEYIDDHLIIEWPNKGVDKILDYDLSIDIEINGDARVVTLKTKDNAVKDKLSVYAGQIKDSSR